MLLWQSISASPPSSSLLPSPHLFDSQGQGDPLYDGTPFITTGTITGDVSLSENFKPIHPPISLSLSSSSLCISSSPCCHPLFFSPLFLYNASLHGSQWALLQVRLPLAQAHLYRLQQRRWSTVFYFMLRPWQTFLPMFLTMESFSPMERHGNFPLILISSPVL